MRILIVDDEDHVLARLGFALRTGGHQVFTASSKDEAEKVISSNELDCAIIDLKLDYTWEFGGIEVFKFVREKQPEVRSIFLSGFSFENAEELLTGPSSQHDEARAILEEKKTEYIHKGGEEPYINAVLKKLGH